MSVINILSDGSRVDDLTGYTVTLEDLTTLRQIVHSINSRITAMEAES